MKNIYEMNRDELVFHAYGAFRNDMACLSCSEEDAMAEALRTDDDALRAYLVENIDYIDDNISYKGCAVSIIDGWYGVLGTEEEPLFETLSEAVAYIDKEVER